jgi:hypothetical protein
MAHSFYATHHIPRRYWSVFAIAVVLAMASVVWVVIFIGARPTFGVDWDRSQITAPSADSAPAAEYPWPDWTQSSRPIGITDLPGALGGK